MLLRKGRQKPVQPSTERREGTIRAIERLAVVYQEGNLHRLRTELGRHDDTLNAAGKHGEILWRQVGDALTRLIHNVDEELAEVLGASMADQAHHDQTHCRDLSKHRSS